MSYTHFECVAEELAKENPESWAVDVIEKFDILSEQNAFDLTYCLAWKFGLNFDLSSGEFTIKIPSINETICYPRFRAMKLIAVCMSMNDAIKVKDGEE